MRTLIVLAAMLTTIMLLPSPAPGQGPADANAGAATKPSFGPPTAWSLFCQLGAGLALGLAAFGSSVGIGKAGQSAAGAWAKEGKQGQGLRFTYIILVGLPISQTLYAMMVMNKMGAILKDTPHLALANVGVMLGVGVAAGIAEMISAWCQGLIGAAGIRTLSESEGKGFLFVIIAMAIVETVGIFAMVFLLGLLSKAVS